jgi:adenylate cyclase
LEPDPNTESAMQDGAVLFADVSGSTALYQAIGDRAAFAAIRSYLNTLQSTVRRHNGVFVKSSGDDVLCWFASCPDAVAAAREMMQVTGEGALEVHAGLEWGSFVCVENDIFGDCVNTAARLCDLANQRELLVGDACFHHLDAAQQAEFVGISPMRLKGRSEAAHIHSLLVEETGDRTHLSEVASVGVAIWDAVVEYEGRQWRITEGDVVTVGRSNDNAVHVAAPSVSRWHAKIRLTNGLVEYEDHSSRGSVVARTSGEVLPVLRRTIVLSGVGSVILGAKNADPDAPRLYFEVLQR